MRKYQKNNTWWKNTKF